MAFPEDTIMTKDQKIIRAKAGVLELAKQLAVLRPGFETSGCACLGGQG